MTSSNPKGRKQNYLYYECHKKNCTSRERVYVDIAHTQFKSILASLKPSKRVLKLFNELIFNQWDQVIQNNRYHAQLVQDRIEKTDEKLTSIAESNSKGILSDTEAKVRAEEVRNEIAVLKVEI